METQIVGRQQVSSTQPTKHRKDPGPRNHIGNDSTLLYVLRAPSLDGAGSLPVGARTRIAGGARVAVHEDNMPQAVGGARALAVRAIAHKGCTVGGSEKH